MKLIPYLIFNGNGENALMFYKGILGGESEIMRYSDMPDGPGMSVSEDWANKVMHGSLQIADGLVLYLSDAWEGSSATKGDNVSVHLELDSEEELRRIFGAISEGGKITMPAEKVFWGSVYGSVIDKFGISWGFEFQIPQ